MKTLMKITMIKEFTLCLLQAQKSFKEQSKRSL